MLRAKTAQLSASKTSEEALGSAEQLRAALGRIVQLWAVPIWQPCQPCARGHLCTWCMLYGHSRDGVHDV